MNERIRELHSQCKVCDKDTVLYFDYERFAELIVKECMTNLYLNGYDDAVVQIQKHFGVEL
jgi:hypothetical protein